MKTRLFSVARLSYPLAAALAALLAAPAARATDLYWDIDDTVAGTGGAAPSGTWSTGGITWSTSPNGTVATPATTTLATDDLFFSAGVNATGIYGIGLTSTQDAASLTFQDGTATISGASGIITLGGAGGKITVNNGAAATIGAATDTLIGGSVGLTKGGVGTLTLNGSLANTFSGGLNVNGGTLAVDFANLVTPTDLIASGNDLAFGGGTLSVTGKITGTTSQTLGNVTVNSGGGQILVNPNGGTSTTVTLGTLTSSASGGRLEVGQALSAGAGTVTITTTTDKDATGIYGGRVVFANGTAGTGYDWATNAGGGPAYTLGAYAGYAALGLAAGTDAANSRITANQTMTGSRTTNSLKFENPLTAQTLTIGAGNTLTLSNGGLLFTGAGVAQGPRVGTLSATTPFPSIGSITAGNGSGSYDLVVHQYNASSAILIGSIGSTITNNTTISSNIVNNGSNPVTLVKTGPGGLVVAGTANTFTGGIVINQGNIAFNSLNSINNNAITFNANCIAYTFAAQTTSGNITLNNNSQVTICNNNNSFTVTGNVLGNGGISAANGGQGAITLNLNGTGNTFTGPIRFTANNGTQAATINVASLADTDTLGSGNITFGAGSAIPTGNNFGLSSGAVAVTLSNRRFEMASDLVPHQINNASSSALTINSDLIVTGTRAKHLQFGGAGAGLSTFAGAIANATTPTAAGTVPIAVRTTAAVALGGAITLGSVEGITVGSSISGTSIAAGTTIASVNPLTRQVTLSAATTGAAPITTVFTIPNVVNSVSVSKAGAGIWRLTGANTYTGGTSITAGTLEVSNGAALADAGAVTLGNIAGAILKLNNNETIGSLSGGGTTGGAVNLQANTLTVSGGTGTFGGVIQGTDGALIKAGAGTLTLTGANTHTGATTVTGGQLTVSGTGTLAGTSALSVNGGATFNYLPGTVGGTLTLGGASSTLNLADGSTLGLAWNATTSNKITALGAATVGIGTGVGLNMTGTYTPDTSYTILTAASGLDTGKYIFLNPTDFTMVVDKTATSVSITPTTVSPLSAAYWTGTNTVGLTKVWSASDGSGDSNWSTSEGGAVQSLVPGSGADVFIPANPPTSPATATILGANMTIRSLTIADTTNGLSLGADGNTLTITPAVSTAGITMNADVPASTIAAKVAVGASQTWTNNSINDLIVSGSISGGAVTLTKQGSGTLVLAGGGTFAGTLAISAGGVALAPAAAGPYTLSSGITGAATLSVDPFNANGSNLTLTGNLGGFTGTVNVADSGSTDSKLVTSGASSSFGAGTIVNIANGGTWASTVSQTGITVNIFGLGNSANIGALSLDAGILDNTSSVVLKANGSIGGNGSATINAPISEDGGSFSLTKQGTGTIFLGGTNTHSGLTTVSSGVLVLQNAAALGATTAGTTVADLARVELDNLAVTGEAITIAGTGGDSFGALKGRSGTSVWAGPVTVDADLTRIGAATGATLEVSGVIDDGANDYIVRFRPQSATGTVKVTGANTYTGPTQVFGGLVEASTLNSVVGGTASSNFGAPVTAANGRIILGFGAASNNGTLSYIGAGETTDRSVQIGDNVPPTPLASDTGASALENNGASGPLVFSAPTFNTPTNALTGITPTRTLTLGGTNTAANTISGIIQNNQIEGAPTAAVAVTKSGAGSWTLAGANTYTGNTTVTGGTLSLGNASALGTGSATVSGGSLDLGGQAVSNIVNIGSAGTLTGSGGTGAATLAGSVTPGGTGNGLITMASATAAATSTITLQLPATGTRGVDYDAITVSGAIALDGSITVNIAGLTPTIGQTFDLIDSPGPIDVTNFIVGSDLILPALSGGLGWDRSNFASTGVVSIVDAYASWATAKGLTGAPGFENGKNDDPDNDGRTNLDEFAFDGNPLSGANEGKIVGRISTIGADRVMTLTLPVRSGAIFANDGGDQLSAPLEGISYRIEGSVDLSAFANTVSEVTPAITAGLPALSNADWTYRTFRAPGTVSTAPKAFLRANVSETP